MEKLIDLDCVYKVSVIELINNYAKSLIDSEKDSFIFVDIKSLILIIYL